MPFPHFHSGMVTIFTAPINEEVVHDLKSIRSLLAKRVIIQTPNTPCEIIKGHERKDD